MKHLILLTFAVFLFTGAAVVTAQARDCERCNAPKLAAKCGEALAVSKCAPKLTRCQRKALKAPRLFVPKLDKCGKPLFDACGRPRMKLAPAPRCVPADPADLPVRLNSREDAANGLP